LPLAADLKGTSLRGKKSPQDIIICSKPSSDTGLRASELCSLRIQSTGVAPATVHGILRKGHIPRIETLYRIADYLGADHLHILQVAGHLRRADQLPRDPIDYTPMPRSARQPQQDQDQDPLAWQLLQEFRRLPDPWKPELIQIARLLQRLAKHPRPTPVSPDPES
jgi:transcriptional regulator with XRE-family HTH domain